MSNHIAGLFEAVRWATYSARLKNAKTSFKHPRDPCGVLWLGIPDSRLPFLARHHTSMLWCSIPTPHFDRIRRLVSLQAMRTGSMVLGSPDSDFIHRHGPVCPAFGRPRDLKPGLPTDSLKAPDRPIEDCKPDR